MGTGFTEVKSFYEVECKIFRSSVAQVHEWISYLCCGLVYHHIGK